MSTIIDFLQLGGYRLEQPTFEKMQSTYYFILKAMIGHFGIEDVGNYIISGCEVNAGNITEGILYIDGNLCFFEGVNGDVNPKIKKETTTETLEFQNGTTPVVFTKVIAVLDGTGVELNLFTRVPHPFNFPADVVIDPNYIAFTQALLDKLNNIEDYAEVNIKPSWTALPGTSNEILDKPVIPNVLRIGQKDLYNFPATGQEARVVNFPDVGTTNYMVLYSIKSEGIEVLPAQALFNLDILHDVGVFTNTSFNILGFEFNSSLQNLTLHYMIVELPPL
jgi:hypothetical protein